MPNFSVKTETTVLIDFLVVQATMVIEMKESVVDRYVERALADMYQNMRMDIRCPCRRCKLVSLFDPISGTVNEHLLRFGSWRAILNG